MLLPSSLKSLTVLQGSTGTEKKLSAVNKKQLFRISANYMKTFSPLILVRMQEIGRCSFLHRNTSTISKQQNPILKTKRNLLKLPLGNSISVENDTLRKEFISPNSFYCAGVSISATYPKVTVQSTGIKTVNPQTPPTLELEEACLKHCWKY